MKFNHKGAHICDAAVIMCVDFRFTEGYMQGVKDVFGIETFDTWAVPGAAKNFISPDDEAFSSVLINKIRQVSIGLHSIKQLIILDHADCGAYGGRKAFQSIDTETSKHKEDLEATKIRLKQEFPDLEIKIGLATLSEDQEEVKVVEFM